MSISKPLGAGLSLGSLAFPIGGRHLLDNGTATPPPLPVNLAPTPLDFTAWSQSGVYGMPEVTENSFTNQATSGIAFNIGAEPGKSYTVHLEMTRGAGALRIYISAEGDITTNNDVHDIVTGESVTTVVATGPWFVFRASVGDTTTTVTKLQIFEV